LASDSTDFTPYSGGFAMTDEAGNDWSRDPIDLSALQGIDLDVRFSAARVQIRKSALSRVAATATVRNGAITVSVGDAQFHGGALKGRALLEPTPNGEPHVKIEGSIANFNLAPGFSALANVQRLEGKGTLALALESRGAHMHDITRGLAGTVTLAAAGGAITGINVEQVLGRLFFGDVVAYLTSGPIVVMAVEGPNAVSACRAMMGATNPAEAAPGTIRGDFAVSLEENVVHGSADPESAHRELGIWFS
jgi:nucleoside diphosphate kinase